jgi:hypothetical protein
MSFATVHTLELLLASLSIHSSLFVSHLLRASHACLISFAQLGHMSQMEAWGRAGSCARQGFGNLGTLEAIANTPESPHSKRSTYTRDLVQILKRLSSRHNHILLGSSAGLMEAEMSSYIGSHPILLKHLLMPLYSAASVNQATSLCASSCYRKWSLCKPQLGKWRQAPRNHRLDSLINHMYSVLKVYKSHPMAREHCPNHIMDFKNIDHQAIYLLVSSQITSDNVHREMKYWHARHWFNVANDG